MQLMGADESDWVRACDGAGDVLERFERGGEGECRGVAQWAERQGDAGHELALVRPLSAISDAEELMRSRFRVFANLGLRKVGAGFDAQRMKEDLDHLDGFYPEDGFSRDGPVGVRQLDYVRRLFTFLRGLD